MRAKVRRPVVVDAPFEKCYEGEHAQCDDQNDAASTCKLVRGHLGESIARKEVRAISFGRSPSVRRSLAQIEVLGREGASAMRVLVRA